MKQSILQKISGKKPVVRRDSGTFGCQTKASSLDRILTARSRYSVNSITRYNVNCTADKTPTTMRYRNTMTEATHKFAFSSFTSDKA